MPRGPDENRDAAGQKGFSEALAGLRIAGHDEAEGAVGHLLHQRAVLLRRKPVLLEFPLRALHLRHREGHLSSCACKFAFWLRAPLLGSKSALLGRVLHSHAPLLQVIRCARFLPRTSSRSYELSAKGSRERSISTGLTPRLQYAASAGATCFNLCTPIDIC